MMDRPTMQKHYIENKRFDEVKIRMGVCACMCVVAKCLVFDLILSRFYTLTDI